ncbi:MAG: hypothetical protein ABEI77_07375 [Halorientalis sp.]
MGESHKQSDGADSSDQTAQRDHLRTLSFRMREIQRLLAIRVEQENRRLEAEDLEPVSDTTFRRTAESE